MRCWPRSRLVLAWAALSWCAFVCTAIAQAGDAGKADELFRAGKQQLEQRDFARACASFEESLRLDAATGTLLALAICHEGQGKLASAYRDYQEVATRSQREARRDRESAARQKAAALEPKLSRLTIATSIESATVQDFEVRLNGQLLERPLLGKPLPVDEGPQRIEASATGKEPWSTTVSMAQSLDGKTVTVPSLQDAAPPAPVAAQLPAPKPRPTAQRSQQPRSADDSASDSGGLSATQWAGVFTLGCGLTSFGAMAYFGLHAKSLNGESASQCDGDLCTAAGRSKRLDAIAAGNAASIATVVGAALSLTGVVLYFAGASGHRSSASASGDGSALVAAPLVAPHLLGASARGTF